ncbi:MAG: YaiO family outer membrane beta-barrel protein [Bacteroidota bacterium]
MKKLIYIICLVASVGVSAQEAMDYLNQAKEHASNGQLNESLEAIRNGLAVYPKDHDLLAYKTRIHLWRKEYAMADVELDVLFGHYPNDYEGFELQTTRDLWNEDWVQLEESTATALASYPDDAGFQEKRLLSLMKQEKYALAEDYYTQLPQKNAKINELGRQVKLYYHDQVGVAASYSQFDQVLSPWTEGKVQYQHVAKNSWNVSATYANMFDEAGVRFNGEYYPKLGKNLYGFVEAGVSQASIFPEYQAGTALTYVLKAFEVSAGARALKFQAQDNLIHIYTAAAGYYFSRYYANYKAYFSMIESTGELTHTFLLRRFLTNRFHYIQLNATNGSMPLQISNFSEVSRLDASSVLLTYSHLFGHQFIVNGSIGGQMEEYRNGAIRNRMTVGVGVFKLF